VGIYSGCAGYDIVAVGGADTSTFYYYDPQTGDLVGIEGQSLSGTGCIAGQTPDVLLTDSVAGAPPMDATCESDGTIDD